MPIMEPNLTFQVIGTFLVGYLAYFLGIVIRKLAFPGKDSPPLYKQLLLGIVFALVVGTGLIVMLPNTKISDGTFFVTLGLIMEQGMVLQETVTKRLITAVQDV